MFQILKYVGIGLITSDRDSLSLETLGQIYAETQDRSIPVES